MKTNFFLHVKSNGSVRATKTKVATFTDEVTIGMSIDLPDSLFEKPVISGNIVITDDMVAPKEITAEVKENIQEAVKGVDFTLGRNYPILGVNLQPVRHKRKIRSFEDFCNEKDSRVSAGVYGWYWRFKERFNF